MKRVPKQNLSEIQIHLLQIMARFPIGTWVKTRDFENLIDGKQLDKIHLVDPDSLSGHTDRTRRSLFIANRAGPLLGRLAMKQYIFKRPIKPGQNKGSEWKLAPLSDQLKEQGII